MSDLDMTFEGCKMGLHKLKKESLIDREIHSNGF